MRATLKIPGVSSAVSAYIVHALTVFGVAFLGQVISLHAQGKSVSTWAALLASGAAAGIVALVNYALGLVPAFNTFVKQKLNSALGQIIVTSFGTFISVFAAQLVVGASHVVDLGTLGAFLSSAAVAAGVAVLHYLEGLIPVPTPAPTPAPPAGGKRG